MNQGRGYVPCPMVSQISTPARIPFIEHGIIVASMLGVEVSDDLPKLATVIGGCSLPVWVRALVWIEDMPDLME